MQENYLALTGAIAMERRIGLIANNLANVNTIGYRGDHITMGAVEGGPDYQRMEASTDRDLRVDRPRTAFHECLFGVLSGQRVNHKAGAFQETGSPTDLAISGDGFFAVETPQGVRYTRQGQFTLNSQRELVTSDGFPVLDADGLAMTIAAETFAIGRDGTVVGDGGQGLGQIQVATFADNNQLVKDGYSMFRPLDETVQPEPAQPGAVEVHTGVLEGSNVEIMDELVDMIHSQRIYETYQKLIHASDEMSSMLISSVIA